MPIIFCVVKVYEFAIIVRVATTYPDHFKGIESKFDGIMSGFIPLCRAGQMVPEEFLVYR